MAVILGIFGVIYSWVTIVSGSFCAIATILLILDIENELDEIDNSFVEEEETALINSKLEKNNNES